MDKKRIILILSAVVVLCLSTAVYNNNKPKDLTSFIAAGCSAEDYSQQEDIGYITLKLDGVKNRTMVLEVEDRELQEQLLQTDLSDIIGVNMVMTIPAKEINSLPVDPRNFDALKLLYNTDQYDGYIKIEKIFFGEMEESK
ncbi:MAG: hypothetical protein GX094_04145 [Clostridiales bacterium]|jgi:hypothetical protein|nr:hypothetical protein [Clostridiales bacterium]